MFPLIAITIIFIEALTRWPDHGRILAATGIVLNLGLLAVWKYATDAFLMAQPFGLSFVVFLNVSAIVDVYTGKAAKLKPAQQMLYSGFFASVSAGPVTRFKGLASQIETLGHVPVSRDQITTGLMLCIVGLAKAVIVGRPLLIQVSTVVASMGQGADITFFEAWFVVLAAFAGLYFTFSGYSDMAMGVGSAVGLRLAVNFNSPMQSNSSSEFFQRWHISLSKWVEVYVFAPLSKAVSRLPYGSTKNRRIASWALGTIASTTIIAAWHGATPFLAIAGTFIGFWLIINQLPSLVGKNRPRRKRGPIGKVFYRLFFLGSTAPIVFVYFAGTSDAYVAVIWSLVDIRQLSLPGSLQGPLSFLAPLGVRFDGLFAVIKDRPYWVTHLGAALILALAAPNTMEMFGFVKSGTKVRLNAQAGFWLGLALGLLAAFSIGFLGIGQGFVYDTF